MRENEGGILKEPDTKMNFYLYQGTGYLSEPFSQIRIDFPEPLQYTHSLFLPRKWNLWQQNDCLQN